MDTQQKEQVVADLSARLATGNAAFVVQYQGCSCEELTGLRGSLKPSGAQFLVVKNTLAKRAISDTSAAELDKVLEGPTAIVWAGQDPVAPAKVITEFAKSKDSFMVKAAVVEGKVVDAAQVQSLASLPSREELLAKLLALINAPATRLLQTVNAPASNLVRLLDAWRAKVEENQ